MLSVSSSVHGRNLQGESWIAVPIAGAGHGPGLGGEHRRLVFISDSDSFSDKLLSAMRNEFGGHAVKKD